MEFEIIKDLSPLFILLVVWIISFFALKSTLIKDSKMAVLIVSIILGLISMSFENFRNYIFNIIPLFATVLVIFVFVALTLGVTGKLSMFQKPLSIIVLIVLVGGTIIGIFLNFDNAYHMLPGTSDSGLPDALEEFKDWIYSAQIKQNLIFLISVIIVGIILFKS
jgi:hypothetical protein